ncbi:MAG: hypothetical protein Q9160_004995 [Pyrenula sp. 1 TL-2023]
MSNSGLVYNNTVTPQLKQFLDYCENLDPSELSSLQSEIQKESSIAAQQSSLSAELATINKTSGTGAPSVKSLLAEQTSASALLASLNNQLLAITQTLALTSRDLLSSQLTNTIKLTRTAYVTMASPSSSASRNPHTQTIKTVAPAVIMPVLLSVAIITTVLVYVLRRGRRRREALIASRDVSNGSEYTKPELHADDLQPELDPTTMVRPLEAQSALPPHSDTAGLPAVEHVGHEMD